MEADETMVVAGERRHCWSASCGGWRRPVFAQARVWMSRDSPRATTTTIGLRGLHCCPSFVTGFALAHRVLTDQALYLAALRQRHVLQLGESSAAADGSCTFKLKQRQIQLVSVSCAEIRVSPVESILDGRLDGYCKCARTGFLREAPSNRSLEAQMQ